MASIFPPPGPNLPSFCTLLIQGPYHPTAPLHLALSHVAANPTAKAVVLSPLRHKVLESLNLALDEWLTTHGGEGRVCNAASRVDILYPSTPVHLSLLLSMFHKYTGAFYHPKTTLDKGTSLIVLHELSSYFLGENSQATVSSYLLLVSRALAAVANLSSDTCDVALALFDSGLDRLKLPIVRQVHDDAGQETESSPLKTEAVASFVHRYFEWVGTTEDDALSPSSTSTTSGRSVRMVLTGETEITWKWSESASSAGAGRTTFSWPMDSY